MCSAAGLLAARVNSFESQNRPALTTARGNCRMKERRSFANYLLSTGLVQKNLCLTTMGIAGRRAVVMGTNEKGYTGRWDAESASLYVLNGKVT